MLPLCLQHIRNPPHETRCHSLALTSLILYQTSAHINNHLFVYIQESNHCNPSPNPSLRKETLFVAPNPPYINVSTLLSVISRLSDENHASWGERKNSTSAHRAKNPACACTRSGLESILFAPGIKMPLLSESNLLVIKTQFIFKQSRENSWSYRENNRRAGT